MRKNYQFVFTILLLIIIIIFIIVRFFLPNDKEEKDVVEPLSKMEVIDVYPPPGEYDTLIPNLSIIVTFSQTPKNIDVEIEPKISFETIQDDESPDRIIIRPKTNWAVGTKYNISINADSVYGAKLISEYKFDFTPKLIEEIPSIE